MVEGEMQVPDGRFDTSLYSFESVSGVETIFEIGVSVRASQKAKGASEGFVVNQSIIDQPSETQKEDITRWEDGRTWAPERPMEWERAALDKIEGGMEDLGMWAREELKESGAVECFSRHHTEKKTYFLYSAVANAGMR
jgi:hypothetical protein